VTSKSKQEQGPYKASSAVVGVGPTGFVKFEKTNYLKIKIII
jgi:hypothetical protein